VISVIGSISSLRVIIIPLSIGLTDKNVEIVRSNIVIGGGVPTSPLVCEFLIVIVLPFRQKNKIKPFS
jgi:hypothetical protein